MRARGMRLLYANILRGNNLARQDGLHFCEEDLTMNPAFRSHCFVV